MNAALLRYQLKFSVLIGGKVHRISYNYIESIKTVHWSQLFSWSNTMGGTYVCRLNVSVGRVKSPFSRLSTSAIMIIAW